MTRNLSEATREFHRRNFEIFSRLSVEFSGRATDLIEAIDKYENSGDNTPSPEFITINLNNRKN